MNLLKGLLNNFEKQKFEIRNSRSGKMAMEREIGDYSVWKEKEYKTENNENFKNNNNLKKN